MKTTHFLPFRASLIWASLCLLLVSCNTASVRFYNRASDLFELYIDGQRQGVVPANVFVERSVEEGAHTFRVVQASGYLISPTEYSTSASVKAGQSMEWSWGNFLLPSN
jgi:hypothetical protein